MTGSDTKSATSSALGRGDGPAAMHDSSVSEVALAATYKRKWHEDMQVRPFTKTQKHNNDGNAASVVPTCQEIPVALLADKERRAPAVRGRTRLSAAHRDEVWHRRYRCWREKDGLTDGAVTFARLIAASTAVAQEKTGTIRPAGGAERIGEMLTNHWKLRGGDQRVAQYGSVPQTGAHWRQGRAV
jgi:hypothetical protein